MTTAAETTAILSTLNDTIEMLQKSTRRTVPMFLVGIVATLIAAGVAVYYIVTLSADLRDARQRLRDSQATLSETQGKLATLDDALRKTQRNLSSPAAAQTIADAISDVNSSQQALTAASSSINAAAAKLPETAAGAPVGTCRLQVNGVTYLDGSCEIELSKGGSFRIWTVGRMGPSASVMRQGPNGIGSWQAAPGAAAVNLGMLRRRGACWSNENGQICAWK